jgi:SAM-dependent methyltransferase
MSIDKLPRPAQSRTPTRRKKRPRPRSRHSSSKKVKQAAPQQKPPRSVSPLAPKKSAPRELPSALQRLSAVTFRAPDDVRGCVDDDTEHDLFCRHHLAWRRQVVEELTRLSPSELAAVREQDTDRPWVRLEELYLGLARRWGQRIQFVAPLQMEDDATVEQALAHVSLEPEAHDSGWLFYSHEGLSQVLSRSISSTSTSANGYDFEDPDIALSSADARKYWVFASDHERDDAGGNSAHMLALYRLFSGCEQASFDGRSGVDTPLPLELFLRLGCMLVVVVQTEGTVVYVPSATANESAHFVTTASDRAAVSVAGNVLGPRHILRLVRQHEEDGPSEEVRLEWAHDFVEAGSEEVAETEPYAIGVSSPPLQVPTAAAINEMHTFLCGVPEDDARYQPEFYRQSWIPDLFSTAQACRILSEAVDDDALPSAIVVEQLLDAGRFCTPVTRSVLAALSIKAARSARFKLTPSVFKCSARLGCPGHLQVAHIHSAVVRVHTIRRPPLLLTTAVDTTPTQENLVRHVHQGITHGVVVCNSLLPKEEMRSQPGKKRGTQEQLQQPVSDDAVARPYELEKWFKSQTNGEDTLTIDWMQASLRERGAVYLTDIASDEQKQPAPSTWNDRAEAMVRDLIGKQTAAGFLLRHCSHHRPGVHSPSFFALFSAEGAHITSPHHNESHRVAAWHLLLRHPKPASGSMEIRSINNTSASPVLPLLVSTRRASPESISLIHQSMAAKSKVIAGSDHLLDDIDSNDSSRRKSSPRDLYAGSVSLSFGELTEDSSWKVLDALAMTSSSRLLDVGSAFGRFCIHAALASPPGVSVTGIEVGIKRAQLASQYLEELTVEHNAIMTPVRPNIKLIQGDILSHLPLLFAHSHVFLFDARFMESTWHILAHLLSHLSGVEGQVVISCQPLHACNADLVCGEPVSLTLSGGKQSFTAHVYKVSSRKKHRHAVEVFESPVHGLGVRAVRALRVGQTIMRVIGEEIYDTTFAQKSDVSKQGVYPYLTRMPSLDKPGKRAFLHALDVSRYINSHVNTPHTQNVALRTVDSELYVVAVREIGRGEELLSHYQNWSTDGERPWLTDEDLLR